MPLIRDEMIATFEEMLATFKERNTRYADNYLIVGQVMKALFPNGITLSTEDDFIRFHFFDWMIGKITRFTAHGDLNDYDSILDEAVYSVMLATLTRMKNNEDKK